MPDILVLGAGPAGVVSALRVADLGASTTLVSYGILGRVAASAARQLGLSNGIHD